MMKIRTARETDKQDLYRLWHTVFGDDETYLDMYFARYFDPAQVKVGETDGHVVSMCSSYRHAGLYVNGKILGTCPAAFAGATYEENRGGGTGLTLIHRQLTEGALSDGNGYSMLAPAEESLYTLYGERFGMRDYFYGLKFCYGPLRISGSDGSEERGRLRKLSSQEYNRRREAALKDVNHLVFTDRQMEMENDICALGGGGLYEVRGGSYLALCAAEPLSEDYVRINELLIQKENLADAMMRIADAFPAEQYELRTIPVIAALPENLAEQYPGFLSQPQMIHTGMLLALTPDGGVSDSPLPGGSAYAGFVFD